MPPGPERSKALTKADRLRHAPEIYKQFFLANSDRPNEHRRGLSHADCGEHHTGQVNANEAKARDSGCCAIFHLSILLLMDNVSISGRQNLAIAPVPQSQLFVGNHPWHFRLAGYYALFWS